MFSTNGRAGGEGREQCGERTRKPLGRHFWRIKALLLVLCAGESLPQQSLAFGFFTLPRGVHVALSSRPRLPSRGGHKGGQRAGTCIGALVHFFLCARRKFVTRAARFPALRTLLYEGYWLQIVLAAVAVRVVVVVGACLTSLVYLSSSASLRCHPSSPFHEALSPCRDFHLPTRPSPIRQTWRCPHSSSARCGSGMSHKREESRQADSLAGGVHRG